jgi:hypothetical protein
MKEISLGGVTVSDSAPAHPEIVKLMEEGIKAKNIRPGIWTVQSGVASDGGPYGVRFDHSKAEYRPMGKVVVMDGLEPVTDPLVLEKIAAVRVYNTGVPAILQSLGWNGNGNGKAPVPSTSGAQQQPAPAQNSAHGSQPAADSTPAKPTTSETSKSAPAAADPLPTAPSESETKAAPTASTSTPEVLPAVRSTGNGNGHMPAVVQNPKDLMAAGKEFMQPVDKQPEELVVSLGGKRYATKNGRLLALHMSNRRIRKIGVDIIQTPYQKGDDLQFEPGTAVIKATVILDNGTPEGETYEAYGEASPKNTSKMIREGGNLLHMAETRAKNRAIGDAIAGGWYIGSQTPAYDLQVNGTCSAEEMAEFAGVPDAGA